jgi:predicted RNase H-like HicB family nuclease
MLSDFIRKKLAAARYKLLRDGTYFGEIPGLRGVWANASSLERCRDNLREVLEDWLVLKFRSREKIPGLVIKTDRRQLAHNG